MNILFLLLLAVSAFAEDSGPVGYYSNGTMRNGVELPVAGPGFMKLFTHRKRAWGTKEMISLITNSSGEMFRRYPNFDRLQVGDISQEGGGPVTDLHSSHQNGLDVDLTYYRKNRIEQPVSHTNGFSENMVVRGRLSKNFDGPRNWEFFKALHAAGDVQRIFVDPAIKTEMCRLARRENELYRFEEVLRSLRPYPNHGDHMHVRLRCPPDALECTSQEDPPSGSGCGRR